MTSKHRSIDKLLPKSEWDFSGLDRADLRAARHWEFSRTAFLEAGNKRETSPIDPYTPYSEYPLSWPEKPFLVLSKEERILWAESFQKIPSIRLISPEDAQKFFSNTSSGEMGWASSDGKTWIGAFLIDWSASKHQLAEDFNKLIEKHYPPDEEIERIERRGGAAPDSPKRLKADLQALGKYRRILHHKDNTIAEIIEAYERSEKSSNESDWSEAKTRAMTFLKSFR